MVAASHGRVTEVLDVPSDSVDAQLEHLFDTTPPDAARVGIVGDAKTVPLIFKRLEASLSGPLLFDVTLSGPSGEDLIGQNGVDAIADHLHVPDLVAIRGIDAQLMAGMEIADLNQAQVAVQRLHGLGAEHVLLRAGNIEYPAGNGSPGGTRDMAVDLYYDGDEFHLFEAPYLKAANLRGASSALCMTLLRERLQGQSWPDSIQAAKAFVTESIRAGVDSDCSTPDFFWGLSKEASSS